LRVFNGPITSFVYNNSLTHRQNLPGL
jgi:hypothetical protein